MPKFDKACKVALFSYKEKKIHINDTLFLSSTAYNFLCVPQSTMVCACADKGARIHKTRQFLKAPDAPPEALTILNSGNGFQVSPILYSLLELRKFDYDMPRTTLRGKEDKRTYREFFPPAYFDLINRNFDCAIFWTTS